MSLVNNTPFSLKYALVMLSAICISITWGHHQGVSEKLLTAIYNKYGPIATTRVKFWQELIHQNLNATDVQKLETVNDFFNEARFIDDVTLWRKRDYWATPLEFLIRDAGDCEDFSIAKYFTLKEMGMDISKLRITYVKAIKLNQAHMVLAYYATPTSEPLILDNLNRRIRPASKRQDLKPVYSFNADSLWLARARNEQLNAGAPSQINLWQELNSRMEKELL